MAAELLRQGYAAVGKGQYISGQGVAVCWLCQIMAVFLLRWCDLSWVVCLDCEVYVSWQQLAIHCDGCQYIINTSAVNPGLFSPLSIFMLLTSLGHGRMQHIRLVNCLSWRDYVVMF